MRGRRKKGLVFTKTFCKAGNPYAETAWSSRTIEMKTESAVSFHQDGVEVPKDWSDRAAFIAASKYFRGHIGKENREYSVKQLFNRVVDTISAKGVELGYFDKVNSKIFNAELKKLLVEQRIAFNSPVFFNIGAEVTPQAAACFILTVDDNLESIAELQSAETKLFSMGSGSGTNLSTLRAAGEPLSRGGWASGPLSFLRAYDSWAGIIRSGGVLRRASKMMRLDDTHPDVTDFIAFKMKEEQKARALYEEGYPPEEAYRTVSGQNCNLSVGISDAFMRAATEGGEWDLKSTTTGKIVKSVKAAEMLDQIAQGIWECGDPGVQYDDRINEWNTVPKYGKIMCSNPCGEVLQPRNAACNLLSLNLAKFFGAPDFVFFEEEFLAAVRLSIVAQDIIVDLGSYPLPQVEEGAKALRPLGLGYANLGGLLMSLGMAYGSETAQRLASGITALMTGAAYRTSTEIASIKGPFPEYEANKKHVSSVVKKHKSCLDAIPTINLPSMISEILERAEEVWTEVLANLPSCGVRNSQVTVLPPTGTVGIMMDVDTTGVEPVTMLISHKALVGGGSMKLTINSVKPGLEALGYNPAEVDIVNKYIAENGTAEGSPIKEKDLVVFDTAYPVPGKTRCLSAQAHLLMLSAVQPFISGGISKTIGQPNTVSVSEIKDTLITAWRLGLKSVTIFRDGSKIIAPLSGQKRRNKTSMGRERLPHTVPSIRHKFEIGGVEGYLHVGLTEDSRVAELFITIAKEGSTLRGLMDAFATSISIALQYHVPLSVFVEKFKSMKFEPWGVTRDPDIRICTSIVDYVFRYLAKYDPESTEALNTVTAKEEKSISKSEREHDRKSAAIPTYNMCPSCGSILVRVGNCTFCPMGCTEGGSGTCGG